MMDADDIVPIRLKALLKEPKNIDDHPRHFAAGDAICRIDEHGDSMMAVVLGVVRISLPVVRGKEIILADLRACEMFGEIAMLANATAHTNCELMVLERGDVLPFLERNPAAYMKLMEILCARICRSDERMSDIAFFGQRRPRRPRPATCHDGDRDLSHRCARWSCRALPGLCSQPHRLQFLP